MKLKVLALVCSAASLLLSPSASPGADELLASHKVTLVTEAINYDANGLVAGKEVVKDSKVDIKERIAERYAGDGRGGLRLVGRTTTLQDTTVKVVTTVESLPDPGAINLVVISVNTVTRDASGGSLTVTETRDPHGQLEVTGRVTVKKEPRQIITTVEAIGKDGLLVVTSQTTTQRNGNAPSQFFQ